MQKVISVLYIASLLICVVCVPMSAIMIIYKLCVTTTLSWLGCCVPLMVAFAATPLLIITKLLLDLREGK